MKVWRSRNQLSTFSNGWKVTETDIERYIVYMKRDYVPRRRNSDDKKPLAPSSVKVVVRSVRSYFIWASKAFNIPRPDTTIKIPRFRPREVEPYSKEEVVGMINACKYMKQAKTKGRRSFTMKRSEGPRDTALIMMLLDTGLRISEVCRLNIGDVNLEDRSIKIEPHGTGIKTRPRTVYIGVKTVEAVWMWLNSRTPYHHENSLFITRNKVRMNKNSASLMVIRLGERAGVENPTCHRFRHTFAIEFLRGGGNIFSLQKLLGHSSLVMVQNYLHLASSDVREAHREASPGDRML